MADASTTVQPDSLASDIALYCPACMYDLRALNGDHCPECGAPVDRTQLERSSIHWVHREGIGIGAFLKTAMQATFKTDFFCMEIARPVSLTDARKFRRRVVWLLWIVISLGALGITILATEEYDPTWQLWMHSKPLTIAIGLVLVGLLWLFLMGWTGLHMYWFHPKALPVEQQNRAIALSHYACSPLLVFAIAVVGFTTANVVGIISDDRDIELLRWMAVGQLILSFIFGLVAIVSYLFVCARMAKHTCSRGGMTRLLLWLSLPVYWLLWAVVVLGLLPAALIYCYVIFGTI